MIKSAGKRGGSESSRMAKSAKTSHPWDPDYDENSRSSIIENQDFIKKLTENMPPILKGLDLSDKFWSLLLERGVVDEDTKTRIQGYKERHVQAVSLVQHVMTVEVFKFHGFIWALVNTSQCDLVELLGFAVCDYLNMDVYLMSSAFHCPACQEFYTKAYILTGCGHYVCAPCVKGAQFICKGNKKEDITCPVPECGKISEASPSAGNIGLEEDENFSDLCEAMQKEVTKESVLTTEGKSTTESVDGVKIYQHLQGEIAENGLEMKVSCLQKYKDVLEKSEQGVNDYVIGTVEKVKQNVDDWAKETLRWYSSVYQQVEKNLPKSVKWQKAASELSILMRAKPGFLKGCLKGEINLPKETVTDAGEKLITKLDAGCHIPSMLSCFSYNTGSPVKAKPLIHCELGNVQWFGLNHLAWMPNGSLMVLTEGGVWRCDLNTDTAECKSTLIQETSNATDISAAADGTWALVNNGLIEIHYPGQEEVKHWKPEGVDKASCVFINKNNIFVGQEDSQTIISYNRELIYVDKYDIGTNNKHRYTHVTERGKLIQSSNTESRIYTMDLETKKASFFGSKGNGDGKLSNPWGVCTVNDGDYILVCDCSNRRVSVFTHDGQFLHHLDMGMNDVKPGAIGVLPRSGKPSLMALDGVYNGKRGIYVHTLN